MQSTCGDTMTDDDRRGHPPVRSRVVTPTSPRLALAFDPVGAARAHWIAHGWKDAAPGLAVVTSIMRAEQIFLLQANT